MKANFKEVVTWFAIFLLTFTLASFFMFPIKAPDSLTVTPEADRVTIENPLVKIVISTTGVRPIKWTTAEGLELAADAKPSGAIGNRTPLWDWIPSQDWPGELSIGNYSYGIVGLNETVATIRFNYTCNQSPIAGLQVVKILTFYADKYYFDMKVILRNPTGSSIGTGAPWDARVGYNINAVGFLEPLPCLYQGYQDGETPYLDLNLGWKRRNAKELKWIAIYNRGTGTIIAIAIFNATSTVWLEGARGAWGSETRVEYPPVTIAPNKEVAYILEVYGGPPDFDQLSEADMVNLARGIGQIIHIRADGSVDPSTAPIFTMDNVTYTFTADINGSIVVERDNVVVDGAGYTVQGTRSGTGIALIGRSNVTIKNTEIKTFNLGITLWYSSNNSISWNNITNNGGGIGLSYSIYNSVSGNNIANNSDGIWLYRSLNNSVYGNNIANNLYGIELYESSNNVIYHNNFIGNRYRPFDIYASVNVWDDGYPSGGNYWARRVDLKSGPNQDQPGSDGIGDKPAVIDANNRDRYPFVGPINIFNIGIWNGEPCDVYVVSNSTVSNFHLSATQKIISFNVTGEAGLGFCRVTIPNVIVQDLWQGNYIVLINGQPVDFRNWTDNTNAHIFFTYQHSEHEVIIIPEFPSTIFLSLFMIIALVATILQKKVQTTMKLHS